MAETMVKPAPRKPKRRASSPPPPPPDPYQELRSVLEMFGNDRPYTFLGFVGKGWKIQFSGDASPTIVSFEDEKPVMIKEGE